MRRITYRSPGTGLRLDGDNGDVLDVSGGRGKGSPMTLFVAAARGAAGERAASISLEPGEVALLVEQCAHYLAWSNGIEDPR